MRTHYFQHVPFEGLGSIGPWLVSAGFELTCTRFFDQIELPDPDSIDFLVVMGGPMSVNDEELYPWLVAEKQFIRTAIASGTPVLGVCLGAQLIASALGAGIYPNTVKEIGWLPIQGIHADDPSIFHFPASETVFHWHGETFDLPPGSTRIAKSEACDNQAFQVGKSVIGLQFHLETTPQSAREIVDNCRGELVPAQYIQSIQSEEEILAADTERYASINSLMGRILSFLLKSVELKQG